MLTILVSLLVLIRLTCAANDTECAVNIPGHTHHGDCDLLCRPATWTDIVLFFLGNYAAHAATVIPLPGQSLANSVFSVVAALLFPGSGVMRGIQAIKSRAIFAPTELKTAARAGALCTVVRRSRDQDQGREHTNQGNERHELRVLQEDAQNIPAEPIEDINRRRDHPAILSTKVHGVCKLPPGYDLMVLPWNADFEDDAGDPQAPFWARIGNAFRAPFQPGTQDRRLIACSYNFVKILVSTGQLLFAIATLYRTRGNQITIYGYSAFGLTVSQYAWMSFINLAGNAIRPQYPTLFLVRSQGLVEASRHPDGKLDGTVGQLSQETEERLQNRYNDLVSMPRADKPRLEFVERALRLFSMPRSDKPRLEFVERALRLFEISEIDFATMGWAIWISSVPIAIIGALSHFSMGQSQMFQRVWTMLWLVFGFAFGPYLAFFFGPEIEPRPILGRPLMMFPVKHYAITMAVYAIPAIGGFVVVGQMMTEYGVCFVVK